MNNINIPEVPELTFDDLELKMTVFDLHDCRFGEIIGIENDDDDWRMIEVLWDTDGDHNDVSHVLPGTTIGVVSLIDPSEIDRVRQEIVDNGELSQDEVDQSQVVVLAMVEWN